MTIDRIAADVNAASAALASALDEIIEPPSQSIGWARGQANVGQEAARRWHRLISDAYALTGRRFAAVMMPRVDRYTEVVVTKLDEIKAMPESTPMAWAAARAEAARDAYHQLLWLSGAGVLAARDFAAAGAPVDDARAELAEARAALAEARTRAEHAAHNHRTLVEQVARLGGRVTALERELTTEHERTATVARALAEARREATTVREQLGEARAALAAARAPAQPDRDQADPAPAARAEAAALRDELAAARAELVAVQGRVDELRADRQAQQARADSLAAELAEARALCGADRVALELELEALRERVSERDRRIAALEREVEGSSGIGQMVTSAAVGFVLSRFGGGGGR